MAWVAGNVKGVNNIKFKGATKMQVYGSIDVSIGDYIQKNVYRLFKENLRDYLQNKNCVILPGNYIYIIGENEAQNVQNLVTSIFPKIDSQYPKKENISTQEETRIYNTSRLTIKKMFFQTYQFTGSREFRTFLSFKKDGSIDNSKTDIKVYLFSGQKLLTEDNEMMNFLMFEYHRKYSNRMTFNDYICGLHFPEYGRANNLLFNVVLKKESKFLNWPVDKIISTIIYPNQKWKRSAELTAMQLDNSGIFGDGEYYFFSEESEFYAGIYEKLADVIKYSNIFDKYYRNLNTNKYFISDALAYKSGSLASGILKRKIIQLSRKPSIDKLKNIFETMDYYFSIKELIPISFKQLVENKLILEEISKKSFIKIINPPKIKNGLSKYSGIQLDDYDLLLLDLIMRVKSGESVNNIIKENIKIDTNTFQYTKGSFTNFYFEFDLLLGSDKKRYMFEVSGSVKIRPKKTTSPTGEGTINTQSLNYVMNSIYKGNYNQVLTKITQNRIKNFNPKLSITAQKYFTAIKKKELMTPSKKYDTKTALILSVFLSKQNDKEECINHLLAYAKKLKVNNIPEKFRNEDDVLNLLGKICGKELGIIFDSNVEIARNIVKITLNPEQKNKIIASAWAMLSARGPIEFNDITFKGKDEIEEVMKYQIKFPALVKIGK